MQALRALITLWFALAATQPRTKSTFTLSKSNPATFLQVLLHRKIHAGYPSGSQTTWRSPIEVPVNSETTGTCQSGSQLSLL